MLFKRLRPVGCADGLTASPGLDPRRESTSPAVELGASPTSPGASSSAAGYGMRPFAGDGGGRVDTMAAWIGVGNVVDVMLKVMISLLSAGSSWTSAKERE
jgi:hypothetical protein